MTDRLIAVEEHFMLPELLEAGRRYLALRIILSGTLDRYPGTRIVLGHLGEHIPFSLPRLDAHHEQTRAKTHPDLAGRPSEYVKQHVFVSTSGMNHAPASFRFCIDTLGADRGGSALAHANAERVFGLQPVTSDDSAVTR